MIRRPRSARTGSGVSPTQVTVAPGTRDSTSYGPTASNAVISSKTGMAICIWTPVGQAAARKRLR